MKRISEAVWNGDLKTGSGEVKLGSGAFAGQYSFSSRFESGVGTNPEELIGAAHAGCYSMALSAALEKKGYIPVQVATIATVKLEKTDAGFTITKILLEVEAFVKKIDEEHFLEIANEAKMNCPVSRALSAVSIELSARLL
jgi:lipoyl-dependent peroxiredoxin